MSFAPIVITFQKKNADDDILKITPNSGSYGFDVLFDQNTIGNKVSLYIEQYDITTYLFRFLKPLALDENGYDFVQIDCPGYSSVVVKTANIERYFPILSAQILSHLASWPVEKLKSKNFRDVFDDAQEPANFRT